MNSIVYGIDGTILDTQGAKPVIFSRFINELWKIETQEAQKYWMDTIGGPRREKFEYFSREARGKGLSDYEYDFIDKEFGKRLKNVYRECNLILGVPEAFKFSKEKFDTVFAVTGTSQPEINEAFEYRELIKYFTKVYGTSKQFKDKKEQIKDIKNSYHPDFMLLVSHSKEDISVGKEFGAHCIGLTTVYPEKELRNSGASEIIPNLRMLPAIAKKFI
jgi:phosphoglycolate phosphatase-like HAD superfamily hydrolase